MKAQSSIEYIVMVALLLLFLTPLIYYAFERYSNDIRYNQATDAVNTVAKAADTVYALGPGTKKTVNIVIPSGVQNFTINDNELTLKLQIYASTSDFVAKTKVELKENTPLPTKKGIYHIPIEMLDSGEVQVG